MAQKIELLLFVPIVLGCHAFAQTGPVASVSPTNLDFGQFTVLGGTVLAALLTNTGNATLNVSSVVVSPGFTLLEPISCVLVPLAPGGVCEIQIQFSPLQPGLFMGQVTITDDAPDSPQIVALSGKGTYLMFSPLKLYFGDVLPGQSGPPQTVTITNTSSAPLGIGGFATGGPQKNDFIVQGSTCPASLNAGATCKVTAVFAPSSLESAVGVIFVASAEAGSPNTIGVSGNGTYVGLSASKLSFGIVGLGGTSPPQTITLTNLGTAELNISGITLAGGQGRGDYVIQGNTCPATVAPGESCSIVVVFQPGVPGPKAAAVAIADDGGGSPQYVYLSGYAT